MAVTKILAKSMRIDKLINYVCNPNKTDEQTFVSCVGCRRETAADTWMQTKRRYGKTNGVQAFHIIQAFEPGEVTPEVAHEIGNRFAKEYLDGFEVIVGTHVDKHHIHNHIIYNSVSDRDGSKYHSSKESYYREIRGLSDSLCREYGLSVIENPSRHAISRVEWEMKQAGILTDREMVQQDIRECLTLALDIGDFYGLMEDRGYKIHYGKYPSFQPHGSQKSFRAKEHGRSMTEDDLRNRWEEIFDLPESEYISPADRRMFVPYPKAKGFRALYLSWMYALGMIGKGHHSATPKISKEQLALFKQYKAQQAYLDKYGIDTVEQLNDRVMDVSSRIADLEKTRVILNAKKKRMRPMYEALSTVERLSDIPKLNEMGTDGIDDEMAEYTEASKILCGRDQDELRSERSRLYTMLSDTNAEIRELRKEQELCMAIHHDVPRIEAAINDQLRIQQMQNEHRDEYDR